jgi:heterodisulfide reductase subunit C
MESIESSCYHKPMSLAREALAGEPGGTNNGKASYRPGEEKLLEKAGIFLRQDACSDCFRCMTCTNACPIVKSYDNPGQQLGLLPHQLMHAVGLRLWGLAFSSRMLWECLGCYKCQEYCPMSVPVTELIFALRNTAISRAVQKFTHMHQEKI